MDLFSIVCTTCKSRLKVREESAIGQILACPKCGGMVMVNPPAGWKKGEPLPPPATQLSSSALPITTVVEVRKPDETLGDSNFDVVDDLLSDAPPKMRTPSSVSVAPDAPGLARPRFVGAPPPASGPPAQVPAARVGEVSPTSATPPAALTAPAVGEGLGTKGKPVADHPSKSATPAAATSIAAVQPSAETLKPPPPGEANTEGPDSADLSPPDWTPPRPWRYWVMMGGSVIAGIVLALAVVVGMIQFFRDEPRTIAQAGTTPQQPVVPATNPSTGPIVPTTTLPTNPAPPVPENPAANVTPVPAVEPLPMPPMPMPPMPMPAVEPDPLGIAEPPQPEVKPANPNDPLAKFDRLIGSDEAPMGTAESEAAPLPMPMATEEPEKPALPRPAPRTVNVTARLADPLRIETTGTPLADFLQFFQDLTTIPITLQPGALPFVRASAESPVVLSAEEAATSATVGAALAAGLKKLGLEYTVAEDELLVRVIEPPMRPTLSFPVKDLAADEAEMAAVADMLRALIEPASWVENGGEGTLIVDAAEGKLVVSQRRAVHAPLLIACEKLRTARKLPYKTTLGPALFQLDTRLARATARLETPISLNFSQPTPLVRILDYLGKSGGVRILVDWQDIAAAGWNPDGEATLIADKQPLAAALDALLGPMDLAWRVVDGQTIQVLTPDSLAARLELEFYKVDGLTGDDPTGDTLVAKLQSILGEAHFREAGGSGELRYDPAGQCLLASLPQPQHRELEALLAKLRSAALPK